MNEICKICGEKKEGINFNQWVKDTFTNFDKLHQGTIICHDCLFWFNESDTELAKKVGKDKPQRMRTYSHFIKNGIWTPYLKDKKDEMLQQLITFPFPELAVISDSGQKHLVFRAKRNLAGCANGWVQFEEMSFYLFVDQFLSLYKLVNEMYQYFNKDEIRKGAYNNYRQMELLGLDTFSNLEYQINQYRSSYMFELCLFFVKKDEKKQEGINERREKKKNSTDVNKNLGVNRCRLQTKVCTYNLEAVRRQCQDISDDNKSAEIFQLNLF